MKRSPKQGNYFYFFSHTIQLHPILELVFTPTNARDAHIGSGDADHCGGGDPRAEARHGLRLDAGNAAAIANPMLGGRSPVPPFHGGNTAAD